METKIVSLNGGDITGALFIEASPTPGAAGVIACSYLVEVLGGVRVLEILSPHFPQVSIINERGIASRPRVELHLVKAGGVKLLIMTRTFPVESNEGSHEIARTLYDYLSTKNVSEYLVLASGRVTGDRSVLVTSTDQANLGLLIAAGAKTSPSLDTLPVDRLTGFLMAFFARDRKRISLLISDTSSYLPDHLAARKLLEVLTKAVNIELDFTRLDSEIERQRRLLQEAEQLGFGAGRDVRDDRSPREPFYIG